MADKVIKIKVDVEADIQPTLAGLKELRKELKEIATTDPKYKVKQQELDDYADALKSAKTGAGNFAEVLGTIPGPLGQIGSQIGGTLQSLKQFGALKFSDIKSSFVELGKDILDAGKGILKLTGITKIYTVINGALAKSFTAIGIAEGVAATGARAFAAALTATGVGALIVVVGLLVDKLIKLGNEYFNQGERIKNVSENLKTQYAEGSKVFTVLSERRIAEAKAEGKSEKELYDLKITLLREERAELFAQQEAQDRLQAAEIKTAGKNKEKLKEINDRYDKETNARSIRQLQIDTTFLNLEVEENDKAAAKKKIINDKAEQEKLKLEGQKQEDLKKITQNQKDAALSLLDDREQERRKIVNDYNEKIKLAAANGAETFILEEAKLKALSELKDKFKKEDDAQQKDLDFKESERLNKLGEDERGIILLRLQSKLEALDAENKRVDGDFEQDLERLKQQREILAEQEATELQNTDLTEFQKTEIRKKYADERRNITDQEIETEKAAMQAKHDINMAYLGLFQQFGNLLGQLAGKNKAIAIAGIVISQAAAIGQIIAQTSIANAKSLAASPLTFGQPWVAINTISAGLSIASTIASAAKSIQQINAQPGASSGTSGVSGASAASLPTAPRVAGTQAPQIQVAGGMNPTTQIGETLTNVQKPLRAYVLSGEISSAQALDRRTSRAATFSGG